MEEGFKIPDRIMRVRETEAMSGLGRSDIYRLEALGKFPRRIPLTQRTTGWLMSEVFAWIKQRAAERAEVAAARVADGQRLAAGRAAKRKAELEAA